MGSFDSFSSAISGMQAQSVALQNISGNIANSRTTGYKTTDTSFQDLLGTQLSEGSVFDGAQALSKSSNTVQGDIQTSSVSTNMAINGDGYFTVKQPSTVDATGQPSFTGSTLEYTRRGDFQVDANGYLVNGAGDFLMGAPINSATGATGTPQILKVDTSTLPTDQGTLTGLAVGTNGNLQATFSSGSTVDVAAIPLSTFSGQGFLQQGDGGTFTATAQSGTAFTATGKVVGGSLESSNTDISDQFTAMIQTQQAYGANTKILTASNEMLQTLTNLTL